MAITEDASQPAAVHATGTSGTTGSFSPPAGSLLVVLLAVDGPSTSATTASVSDSGSHSWSLLKRQNTTNNPQLGGSCEIWVCYLSSAPGSITVTGDWSSTGSAAGDVVVRVLNGAASTQNGATGGAGGNSIAPTCTLTPTVVGSHVYGACLDYTTNASLTANAQTTSIDQFNDATNGDTWAAFKGAADTTTLSSTTFGYTNANASYNVAAAEILPAASAVPWNPQRSVQIADRGESYWLQRDRRDANTVATAANPLPSPLDSAWQASAGSWHLYNDTAARDRRFGAQQRAYVSDPSLLVPPAEMPAPSPQRAVPPRDPGEVQWQQAPRRDPLLLTAAQLEDALLGGADAAKRYLAPATNVPRWWMPQQPKRDGYTPGLLDSAQLEGPLLAGDVRRHYAAAAYTDRREIPQQRPYISDPSFYPTVAPTDPLTLAWGAGGTYWLLYNEAALLVDRREVPQQRRYVCDPGLLLTALLENELLGGADDRQRHAAWPTDRRLAGQHVRQFDPALLVGLDPIAVAAGVGGDLWRRYNTAAYADRREVPAQPPRWTLYFDAGPDIPPLTLAAGTGGNLWHLYQWRRPARSWWPPRLLFAPLGDPCTIPRPSTGVTARPGSGITARPDTGTTEDPC